MEDANSGRPVGEGHRHSEVGEVLVDAAVATVQAAPQGNGVGPVPAVAAADPGIVALLQELLASQQAIAARLTKVVNNQAHPQLQQHQQAQLAHRPQQTALQLAGSSAHSMASATKHATQQAMVTAGIKANTKQAAEPLVGQRGVKIVHRVPRLHRLGENKIENNYW